MLEKRYRLNSHEVRRVRQDGRTYHAPHFVLQTAPASQSGAAGCAVVVSGKMAKTAVARNRLRRRLYAVLAENIAYEALQEALVLFARRGAQELAPADMREEVRGLLTRAGVPVR
jgi:ribonuclease P protein component